MTKKYKVDKTKIIGNVIFVVEGGRPETGGTELRLLKSIFADVLGYEVRELRRGTDEFIGYGNNKSSRVFALNLPKNQLTQFNLYRLRLKLYEGEFEWNLKLLFYDLEIWLLKVMLL